MYTYEEYLDSSKVDTLTIEEAMDIYSGMVKSMRVSTLDAGDKTEFWEDFVNSAIKYTSKRCKWEIMSREARIEEDDGRTKAHDALISATDILARNLGGKHGADVSWRTSLGDERKRIGDFACFVVYMLGISNR